jgi:hypothetical protein
VVSCQSSVLLIYAPPVTASPGAPRLKKAPAAGHPFPQGGEGGNPDKGGDRSRNAETPNPLSHGGEGNVALAMAFGDQLHGVDARYPLVCAFCLRPSAFCLLLFPSP